MKRLDGLPKKSKYGQIDRYAFVNFCCCHNRVKNGKSPSIFWQRTREGYLSFCSHIGPKPDGVQKWSVGRIDHSKGYEPGNVRWELHRMNSVKRKGTRYENSEEAHIKLEDRTPSFKRGTKGWLDHQKRACLKRWSDPAQREKARVKMLGNNFGSKQGDVQ